MRVVAAALAVPLVPVLASLIHVHVVASGRVFDVETAPAGDVLLVLGAKAHPGRPSGFLRARLDRTVELYRAGKGKAVLVSGANTKASNYETEVMRDYLVEHGVPANKVVQDVAGFDTFDSCARARDVFGLRRVTIVSQAYHLPRALATCRALGIEAAGVGDRTAAVNWPWLYWRGELREVLANVKMELDLLRGAKATFSEPTDAVQVALTAD